MASNFPPGVTGNEYAIAGPDYKHESDTPCPHKIGKDEDSLPCGEPTMEQGYQGDRWLVCEHGHTTDLEPPDPGDDPDRKYDEERDRRMLEDEVDTGGGG